MCDGQSKIKTQYNRGQLGYIFAGIIILLLILAVSSRLIPVGSFSAFVSPNHDPDHIDAIGPLLSPLVSSVDSVVTMLTTIQIGLFALVGYSLSQTDKNAERFTSILVASVLFSLMSFFSLYLGYAARMELFFQISSGSLNVENVKVNLWRQGLFITLAALAAFSVAGFAYASKD